MKAKIPKCASLGLQASTGKKVCPMLTLKGYPTQYTAEGVRIWAIKIEMPPNHAKSRVAVLLELERILCKMMPPRLKAKAPIVLSWGESMPVMAAHH